MINYNISLNKELAKIVEQKIKEGKYANRSEFFREMIRRIFVFGENEIESIHPGSNEYKELKKLSADKKDVASYKDFLKNC